MVAYSLGMGCFTITIHPKYAALFKLLYTTLDNISETIIIVSDRKYMTDEFGKLTGFGKEVRRFIDVHGYRWNSDYTRLLPPTN